MDWLDLLAVQGTLKSLLQHHSSKASILLCSAFFIVQLSHPYMTNGKTQKPIIITLVYMYPRKVITQLYKIQLTETSLVAQSVKSLPTMWETWVRSLVQEDPLEKEMAIQSRIPAWEIPWIGAWWATVPGVAESQTQPSVYTLKDHIHSQKKYYVRGQVLKIS